MFNLLSLLLNMNRQFLILNIFLINIILLISIKSYSHPGRTDSNGCHVCRTNCDYWGVAWNAIHCHDTHNHKTAHHLASKNISNNVKHKAIKQIIKEGQQAYVAGVVDGDTINVFLLPEKNKLIKIRILGINCPESNWNEKCVKDGKAGGMNCAQQIPLGKKAKSRAKELLAKKIIYLESEKGDGEFRRDIYKRRLAYIRLDDGNDYGLLMINEGLCEDFSSSYPHARSNLYKNITFQYNVIKM